MCLPTLQTRLSHIGPTPLLLLDTGGDLAVVSTARKRYERSSSICPRAVRQTSCSTAQVTVPRSPDPARARTSSIISTDLRHVDSSLCPHARISNSSQIDCWDLLVNACLPCVRVLTAWMAYVSLRLYKVEANQGPRYSDAEGERSCPTRYHILRDQASLREASQPCSLHKDQRLRYLQAVSLPSTSFDFQLAGPT